MSPPGASTEPTGGTEALVSSDSDSNAPSERDLTVDKCSRVDFDWITRMREGIKQSTELLTVEEALAIHAWTLEDPRPAPRCET